MNYVMHSGLYLFHRQDCITTFLACSV